MEEIGPFESKENSRKKKKKSYRRRYNRLIDRVIIIGSCAVSLGGHYVIDKDHGSDDDYECRHEKIENNIFVNDSISDKKILSDSKTLVLTKGDFLRLKEVKDSIINSKK